MARVAYLQPPRLMIKGRCPLPLMLIAVQSRILRGKSFAVLNPAAGDSQMAENLIAHLYCAPIAAQLALSTVTNKLK